MNKIILERNVDYALWENLIYASMFSIALFVGTTFFSSGNFALTLSIISGLLASICILALLTKKGLVINKKLYRGYFLFDQLFLKREINNPISNKFTILSKKYRQKYIRSHREQNWEYSVDSFELYFFDEDGAIRDEIIVCQKKESSQKAKEFLVKNYSLQYVELD